MKVKEYGSDYITGRSLQVYMSERFSYSDYNSYESKLSQTKKWLLDSNLIWAYLN